MTGAEAQAALERRDARIANLKNSNSSAVEIAAAAQKAFVELKSIVPDSVTGGVRTLISWGGGGVLPAVANSLWPSLPAPLAPAILTVAAIASQFVEMSADGIAAAEAMADGAGAVTSYLVTMRVGEEAMAFFKKM
jgi:hypothetical protein